jgi:hypothetical protein
MKIGRLCRQLTSCIAAYAIALQMAFSGLIVTAHMVADASELSPICRSAVETGRGEGQPPHQDTLCPCGPACTMAGCGVAVGNSSPASAIVWRLSATRQPGRQQPGLCTLPRRDMAGRPQNPRAPPVI